MLYLSILIYLDFAILNIKSITFINPTEPLFL